MRRRKCYISGRISGLPRGEAERNFSSAVLQVFKMGYIPVNPMNTPLPYWWPWILHMLYDCCVLMGCDAIALQENWRESRGARIEHRLAIYLGKEIKFLSF